MSLKECSHGKPIPGDCLACEKTDSAQDRLRKSNAELLAALDKITATKDKDCGGYWEKIEEEREIARAAIDKAGGGGKMTDLFSPALARHSDPSTSHDAAKKASVTVTAGLIFAALRGAPDGLTATEISQRTGIERDTVSPRLPELVRARLIRDSGRKRQPVGRNRKAIVWEAVT